MNRWAGTVVRSLRLPPSSVVIESCIHIRPVGRTRCALNTVAQWTILLFSQARQGLARALMMRIRQLWREEAFFKSLQAMAVNLMADAARACDVRYAELAAEPGGDKLTSFDSQVKHYILYRSLNELTECYCPDCTVLCAFATQTGHKGLCSQP